MDLLPAILLFSGTAAVVVFCGTQLAKYGDLLAIKTGWGRLWVGTLLLAGATSLPELVTGASAALLDSPELVMGNVFGANMVNMFTMAAVALVFGARRFFEAVAREHGYLAVVGICLTGFAAILAAFGPSGAIAHIGVATPIILLLYVAGMRLVYSKRPQDEGDDEDNAPGLTLRRTWTIFGLAGVGVILAAYWMAYSADQIADITGLGAGFVGVVAVALVTTLPEATVTIASVRIGAMDLAAGNVYGSCAFNILILAVADPFYGGGALLNASSPDSSLVVAGGLAVIMMAIGMAQFTLRRQGKGLLPPMPSSALMCAIYLGGLYVIYALEQRVS